MDGLPGASTLFTPPDSGASDVIMQAVESAMTGHTVELGALLAPAGISTIVVMNSAAPELTGVESSPVHKCPGTLMNALAGQSDLSLELQTSSAEVFSNADFHGIYAETKPGSATYDAGLQLRRQASGPVTAGSTVEAGLAPASAFVLNVDGHADTSHNPRLVDAVLPGRLHPRQSHGHGRAPPVPAQRAARSVYSRHVGACVAWLRLDSAP